MATVTKNKKNDIVNCYFVLGHNELILCLMLYDNE